MQELIVGLSESRRTLYVGDRKLIAGCTSFAVHNEFLVFTTDTHTCRFLLLDSDPSGTPYTLHV
jgi:elongator complex protein 1